MDQSLSQELVLKELKNLIESSSLVTARLIESVSMNSQLASSITPEMQHMFHQWMDLITKDILRSFDDYGTINIRKVASEMGISESTVLSLVLYLHRQGTLSIENITACKSDGENREICHCLR